MYDIKRNISAEHPVHREFIYSTAIPAFQKWGYEVTVLRPEKDFLQCFFHRISRSKDPERVGKYRGFPLSGKCIVNRDCKLRPIRKFLNEQNLQDCISYVGIAADETRRLKSLEQEGKVSLLAEYGCSEQMAEELCRTYGLLSPIYRYTKRNGCFFCPNAGREELYLLYRESPALWKELVEISKTENQISPYFNGWKKERLEDIDREFREREEKECNAEEQGGGKGSI